MIETSDQPQRRCDDLQDQIMLYAAGMLEGAERQEVQWHLSRGCTVCQARYAEAIAVLGILPTSLVPVTVPSSLKKKVLDRVDQAEDVAQEGIRLVGSALPARRLPERSGWRFNFGALAVAASIGLILGIAGFYQYMSPVIDARDRLGNELARATDEIDRLRITADAKDRQLARTLADNEALREIAEEQAKTVQNLKNSRDGAIQQVQFLQSPGLKVVELAGLQAQPNAKAYLFFDSQTRKSKLIAQTLTPQPEGRTYELWLITADSKKFPAGTFNADERGTVTATIDIPAGLLPLAAVAISDEPEGGSPQPTGNIHALGKF